VNRKPTGVVIMDMMKDVNMDGTVEGYITETHYTPCESIRRGEGFLRVVIDGPGYDIETRIPFEFLQNAGFIIMP
jgi:hypothetical protein